MKIFDSLDRQALGIGFATFLLVYLPSLLIAGPDVSDTEMILAVWVGFGISLAVGMRVMLKNLASKDK